MNDAMQPGDVVELVCGGAPMVISAWLKDAWGGEGWCCVWQIQGAPRSHIYPAVVLRRVQPDA